MQSIPDVIGKLSCNVRVLIGEQSAISQLIGYNTLMRGFSNRVEGFEDKHLIMVKGCGNIPQFSNEGDVVGVYLGL